MELTAGVSFLGWSKILNSTLTTATSGWRWHSSMTFGLHPLDAVIVVGSIAATIFLGWFVSRKSKEREKDFLTGGKNMGGALQFFLNFGSMADSNGAPTVAAEVYRQGAAGVWINLQLLFTTPFYWFTMVWFRRSRQTTFADLFVDRFGAKKLVVFLAVLNVFTGIVLMGLGNLIAYKVASAMLIKPASAYTVEERASVEKYHEYIRLKGVSESGTLTADEGMLLENLSHSYKRSELKSYISYLKPAHFYVGYTLIVATYIMLGGIRAAAVIDAFQGFLIIIFSVIMIPVGLGVVGGFQGLHEKLPPGAMDLFGSAGTSEYTWYTIAALVLTSSLSAIGNVGPAQASAKNESVVRLGTVGGAFGKRLVTVAWMYCGLIALAIFSGNLADSENAWGVLAYRLLGPGLLGLMIAGALLGHMPAVGVQAVNLAAMISRNIFQAIGDGAARRGELIAKCSVPLVLAAGVFVTMQLPGVIQVLTALITFNAFVGTAGLLLYFWRKLTVAALGVGMVVWLVLMGILPWILPNLDTFSRSPALLLTGQGRLIQVTTPATFDDVASGRAKQVGEVIQTTKSVAGPALFFDAIVSSPKDSQGREGGLQGLGRFNVEMFILHVVGVPVQRFDAAKILASRWLIDGILPFFLLVGLSYLPLERVFKNHVDRKQAQRERDDRFFVKMKTMVLSDPIQDEAELARNYQTPQRFNHTKLFPASAWEFCRWTRADAIGFGLCWLLVLAIVLLAWLTVRLGS